MFDAPILPVEQRVQVYAVEEKTISTPEADITVRIYTPEEGIRILFSCISMEEHSSREI